MRASSNIPSGPESITLDWLNTVLHHSGAIQQAQVRSFQSEPIGEVGLTGQLVRITLNYTQTVDNPPKSLIAKFSSRDPQLRMRLHHMGLYEKEVYFYQKLAPQTTLPTPQCYYAHIDSTSGQSVLLLEDLAHLRIIDISTGCSLTEAEFTIHHLARFHAQWWNHPLLQTAVSITPLEGIASAMHNVYQAVWPQFLNKMAGLTELPKVFLQIGERFCQKPETLFQTLTTTPVTLIHLDCHLDNLFFGQPDHEELMVVDWQMYGYGRGIMDVAYFLVDALPVDLRKASEYHLLQDYHGSLRQQGVTDYSFEQCWMEYQQAIFWKLMTFVIGGAVNDTVQPKIQLYLESVLPRLVTFYEDHASHAHF